MSLLSNLLYKQIQNAGQQDSVKPTRLAVVTSVSGNNTYIKFYGEDVASQKPYKRLGSYTPTAGDTVMVQNINGSYVITGKVV